jgi:3-hydroxybutyryl-CoA dehydrogenase
MPRIGVVGAGTMGAGIAHVFAAAGAFVVVVEADPGRADAGRATIDASLRRAEERRHVPDAGALAERIVVTSDRRELAGVELLVEAVPEDVGLKHAVLAGIEPVVGPATVIGTNTSSISIATLGSVLEHRDRFLGMHFFNPVPASRLVELVRAPDTAAETIDAARSWVRRIDKEAIEVVDSPGFASSRLGLAIGLEAIRMVEDGVASPADIDAAMVLGYRFPVGPLRLTDMVGLDVRLDAATYLAGTLGARFEPPRLLRDKVERGELGRKSGRGFFDWDET